MSNAKLQPLLMRNKNIMTTLVLKLNAANRKSSENNSFAWVETKCYKHRLNYMILVKKKVLKAS